MIIGFLRNIGAMGIRETQSPGLVTSLSGEPSPSITASSTAMDRRRRGTHDPVRPEPAHGAGPGSAKTPVHSEEIMADSSQQRIGRVRPPRVQITYDVEDGGATSTRELPLVAGVVSDLSGDGNGPGSTTPNGNSSKSNKAASKSS